jgi:hypothetical protein
MPNEVIERQAKMLAADNRRAEPGIVRVYWFPDEVEVRLVELLPTVPPSGDRVVPFHFRPRSTDDLPAPSGIALIRPEEFGMLPLPSGWGRWEDAIEIESDGEGED